MCNYDFMEGYTISKYCINNIHLENVIFYKDLRIIFENILYIYIYIYIYIYS